MSSSTSAMANPKEKTVIVIDKDYFALCKRFFLEGAEDEEYANLLNIPLDKVKIFKHKMQNFEKNLRARRKKVVELEPQRRGPKPKKRKAEEKSTNFNSKQVRFESHKKALQVRDLILQGKSNKEIAGSLKVKQSFVTRLRLKMFRQKMQMVEKGELDLKEDEVEFKFLSLEQKAKRIAKLLDEGHRAVDIGKMLQIDERSVNRWRNRLKDMDYDFDKFKTEPKPPSASQSEYRKYQDHIPRYRQLIEKSQVENTQRLLECGLNYRDISKSLGITMTAVMKIKKAILTNKIHEIVDDTAEKIKENVLMKKNGAIEDDEEDFKPRPRRKRRRSSEDEKMELRMKRDKIEIKEEPDSGEETEVDEDWSQSDDEPPKVQKECEAFDDPFAEPEIIIEEAPKVIKTPPEPRKVFRAPPKPPKKSPKPPVKKFYPRDTLGSKPLTDRDSIIAKKLLDNGIRRVDIALMLETTEKSVSKLLEKALGLDTENVDEEISETVENFLMNKEKFKGVQKYYGEKGIVISEEIEEEPKEKRKKKKIESKVERVKDESLSESEEEEEQMEVKKQTALRLLSVNVKITDIVKMLNVPEKTIKRWKADPASKKTSSASLAASKKDSNRTIEKPKVKEEPVDDEYEDL